MHLVFSKRGITTLINPLQMPFSHHGVGLFETLRYQSGVLESFTFHFERMQFSAVQLDLRFPFSQEEVRNWSNQVIQTSEKVSGSLKWRLVNELGEAYLIIDSGDLPYEAGHYTKGFKVCCSAVRKSSTSRLLYHKTMNYFENRLERELARSRGFNEVVFRNTDEKITEGSASNLFYIKNGTVYTPEKKCGLLEGTMRRQVIQYLNEQSVNVVIGSFDLEALYRADEIFLTNALMGVMPVSEFEGKLFNEKTSVLLKTLIDTFGIDDIKK